jgi:hypothetical protein
MRLVQRRIEMPQSKSEVDGIDIFQRRRQERDVRGQIQSRDDENDSASSVGSW